MEIQQGVLMPQHGRPPDFGSYWGKARPDEAGARFHLLAHHSLDVAAVGVAALKRLPPLRLLFRQELGGPACAGLESWVYFWMALHDPGKFAGSCRSQCIEVFEPVRGRPANPAKAYMPCPCQCAVTLQGNQCFGCISRSMVSPQ